MIELLDETLTHSKVSTLVRLWNKTWTFLTSGTRFGWRDGISSTKNTQKSSSKQPWSDTSTISRKQTQTHISEPAWTDFHHNRWSKNSARAQKLVPNGGSGWRLRYYNIVLQKVIIQSGFSCSMIIFSASNVFRRQRGSFAHESGFMSAFLLLQWFCLAGCGCYSVDALLV